MAAAAGLGTAVSSASLRRSSGPGGSDQQRLSPRAQRRPSQSPVPTIVAGLTVEDLRLELRNVVDIIGGALAQRSQDAHDLHAAATSDVAERHDDLSKRSDRVLEAMKESDAANAERLDKITEQLMSLKLVVRNLVSNASHHQGLVTKEVAAIAAMTR